VPESQIVETLIEEAMRLAEEMGQQVDGDGRRSAEGPPASGLEVFRQRGVTADHLDRVKVVVDMALCMPCCAPTPQRGAIAHKVRRWRRQCASIFGPIDPVAGLWERLGPTWGPARTIRREQLLMSTAVDPGDWGLTIDERVRPARVDEVDLVLPASAAMFTEEIGYPPFIGSSTNYRSVVAGLVRLGRTFVWVEGGRVLFKADVGSVGVDAAQIQGVWLAPHLRGRGLATPLMAAVTSAILQGIASEATLYVNDFNIAAIATYEAIGFRRVGTFATILL
jgi:predicted GNAT family acetyltransferase